MGVGSDYSRLADALGDCEEGVSGVELETVQGDGCCVAVHGCAEGERWIHSA